MPLSPPQPELLLGASLFLDFDGTLVELADRPDTITIGARLPELLADLSRKLGGRLVIISGRASADVRSWLAPLDLPVAGSHGLERPGVPALKSVSLDEGLRFLREVEQRFQGVLVEEKPMGAALHYRQAPGAEEACRIAADQAATITGLQVQPGKMVFELKPASGDKGSAVRAIMAEPLHLGTRPIFVGDDLTDEHGFAAVAELGGAGVLVGEERETAATYRLPDVTAVHDWLAAAIGQHI